MGRPPIGKRAMTDAERQRRRRKRLKREKKAAALEAQRQKNHERYLRDAAAQWTQALTLPPETPSEWASRELTNEVGYSNDEVLALLEQLEGDRPRARIETIGHPRHPTPQLQD